MRVQRSLAALALIGAFVGAAFGQVPPGFIVTSASPGAAGTTTVPAGPVTALYLVDPVALTSTPIAGLSDQTNGILVPAGPQVASNGANSLVIDDVTGHLIVGTISSAALGTYTIREITLAPGGASATSDVAIATLVAPATGSLIGVQAIAVLPNGNILTIESSLGAPVATLGLNEYNRSTGFLTPWPITTPPAGVTAANALFYDRGANGGAGAAIIGYIDTTNAINTIVSVPTGGGAATIIAQYNNSTIVVAPAGGGIPTGVCLDGTGNIIVSHNNVVCGTTLINRSVSPATVSAVAPNLAPTVVTSLFQSGENAVAYDVVNDDAIPVANATGSTIANNHAHEVRRIDLGPNTPSVIVQTAGSNTNGVDVRNGANIYGVGCGIAGGPALKIGTLSPSNLGNAGFGVRVNNGTPGAAGLLIVGTAASFLDLTPFGFPGCAVYNNFNFLILPIAFNASGNYTLAAPLPTGPFAGVSVYLQAAESGAGGLKTSPGMRVTFF